MKRYRGTPFVLHVQDLWPDTVTASGFLSNHPARRLQETLHRMCDHIYRHSAAVAVTAPGMIDSIRARGVPTEKLTYLPNWADERAFHPRGDGAGAKAELGLRDSFVVMYAGNFGEFQALDTLVLAAEHLRERRDITFALVGGGVEEEKLRRMVETAALDNVVFIPSQSFDKMADILAAGDVQLISLRDRPLSRLTLPSKLQATLAAGRPIIGALAGDAARVVAESQAGVTVVPGDPSVLARAISELAAQGSEGGRIRGEAARRYYEAHFQQKLGVARMTTLLEQAVEGRTA
jgi:glycosyltransferase involved in cell wall biosynthesis